MSTPSAVAAAIQTNTGDPNALARHYGQVVSLQASVAPPTITCFIDGGSTAVPGIGIMSSYAPIVGDIAWLIRRRSEYIAVGSLADSQSVGSSWSPGDLKMSAAPSDQAGWLVCDGRSLLRTTYADLFAVIGTVYGSADGTHFTIPNFQGKYTVGANGSTYVLGTAGGSTTIAAANLPATSPWQLASDGNSLLTVGATGVTLFEGATPSATTSSISETLNTNSAGGGSAYNPPFNPTTILIKT